VQTKIVPDICRFLVRKEFADRSTLDTDVVIRVRRMFEGIEKGHSTAFEKSA
jgi:hypothetical protein